MAVISKLAVELTLDGTKFKQGLGTAQKSLNEFGEKAKRIGGNLTTRVTAPVVASFGLMINAASDLAEAQSAVEATFGSSAAEIIKASESAATSVGMSSEQYLSATKIMGVYAQAAGLSGDAMVDFSKDTVAAAADLASFHNVPMDEALAAIQSGLSGETEPLKKFGILMNEAALQTYALENGIWDGVDAMTEQQKVLARQGFIMDSLGPAAGDFAKTSGGLANQMRILRAELTNVAAQMGMHLLPLVLRAVEFFRGLIDRFRELSPRAQKFILIGLGIAAALGPVLLIAGQLATAIAALIPLFAALAGPIGIIILVIVALAIAWKKNLFDIQGKTKAFLKFIEPAIETVVALFQYLRDVLTNRIQPGDLAKLPKWLQPIAYVLGRIVKTLRVFVKAWQEKGFLAALRTIPTQIRALGRAISGLLRAAGLERAAQAFKRVFNQLSVVFNNLITFFDHVIHGRWAEAWEAFKDLAVSAVKLWWENLKAQFALFRDIFDAIPWGSIGQALLAGFLMALDFLITTGVPWAQQKGKDLLGAILAGLQTFWEETMQPWLMTLPQLIFDVLAAYYDMMFQLGNFLFDGLGKGIAFAWDWIMGWVKDLPGQMLAFFSGFWNAFFIVGYMLVQAIAVGISSAWQIVIDRLWDAYNSLPGWMRDALGWGAGVAGAAASGMGASSASAMGTPTLATSASIAGAGTGGGMMQPVNVRTIVVNNPANGEEVVAEILRAVKRTKAGMA